MSQIEKFNFIYKTVLKIKLSHIQIKNILFLYSLNKNLSLKKEILKKSDIFFRFATYISEKLFSKILNQWK